MSQWHYARQGVQAGPVDEQQIRDLVASGGIQPNDLVWCEGMAQWAPVAHVPQLMSLAAPLPMPTAPYYGVQQLGYASFQANPRPTSVTVIAIVGIVLGSLGIVGSLCGTIAIVGLHSNPAFQNALQVMPIPWLIMSSIFGLATTILLLVASIQALKLRRWARKGLLVYAISVLVLGVVNLIVTAANSSSGPAAWQQVIATVAGFISGAAFAVCILVFMRRPHVVAAFETDGQ